MNKKMMVLAGVSAWAVASQAIPITVVSHATEDVQYINGAASNRGEMILNNSGANTARFGAARYDADILGAAAGAPAFTDALQYSLTSATLTFVEQAGRDGNNGTQTGRAGAFFMNTAQNSTWTLGNTVAGTYTWFGNSGARPGNWGGGATGDNNADDRSNGSANPLAAFWDGMSWQNHTFVAGNPNELVTIDLTAGGASLPEIQSILADWVAGNNAGMGHGAEFGNQAFFQSMNTAAGASVGSTIDGDSTFSGVAGAGEGGGAGGSYLTLQFEAVPEPATLGMVAVFGGALLFLRRRFKI